MEGSYMIWTDKIRVECQADINRLIATYFLTSMQWIDDPTVYKQDPVSRATRKNLV